MNNPEYTFSHRATHIIQSIQSNLDSSNTDGSFTMANSNSFLSPYKILPIALTRAVVGQRSSPAGYILYCNIFIIKPYNIGHTDLEVFVCKSFCHIDIIIHV